MVSRTLKKTVAHRLIRFSTLTVGLSSLSVFTRQPESEQGAIFLQFALSLTILPPFYLIGMLLFADDLITDLGY